jgi:hypothetical protein
VIRSSDSMEPSYGYCRNSQVIYGWRWLPPTCEEEIIDCLNKCENRTGCVGMSFSLYPSQTSDYNQCSSQSLSRCLVHYNHVTERPRVVTNTSSTDVSVKCYKYEYTPNF